MTQEREILTVGHSTHPIEGFIALLRDAGVEAIADVRRFPGSRRNPQFGAEALGASLVAAEIAYHGLGEDLGGRRSVSATSPNDGWRVAAFRHRRLVADALLARGWRVTHLGPRGELKAHEPPEFATIADGHVTYATQPALGSGPQRVRAT